MAPKKIKGKSLTDAYRPKNLAKSGTRRSAAPTKRKVLASSKRGQTGVDSVLIQIWAGFAFITAVGLFLLFSNARKEKSIQQVQMNPEQTLQKAQEVAPVAVTKPAPAHPLQAKLEELASKPFSERVHFWSYALQQNPALLKDFAQGAPSADTIPVISDRFDCTTYVETVFALARSSSPDQIGNEISQLRYQPGGENSRDFASRNHFMETQWVPFNIQRGIFKDYTKSFTDGLKIKTASVRKTINQRKWFSQILASNQKKSGRAIASDDSGFGLGIEQNFAALPEHIPAQFKDGIGATVSYVAVERFGPNRVKLLPDGSVLNFVRSPKDTQPVVITHQGIVLQTPNGTMLRHASAKDGIKEEPLLEYLQAQSKKRWPLLGVQILTGK